MSESYAFPVRAIVRILVRETQSKYTRERAGDVFIEDEASQMLCEHIARMKELSSYKEINDWLLDYRRLSLQEWIDSF